MRSPARCTTRSAPGLPVAVCPPPPRAFTPGGRAVVGTPDAEGPGYIVAAERYAPGQASVIRRRSKSIPSRGDAWAVGPSARAAYTTARRLGLAVIVLIAIAV